MTKTAVYCGTFNPITLGHVDIVTRAAALFDQIIIGVATSERKSPVISLNERVQICQKIFANIKGIQIQPMSGLAIEFAQKHRANCMIRGVRNITDLEYEQQMIAMNRQMAPDIETIILPAKPEYAYISGTMVREILSLGKDISQFVPKEVVEFFK